MRVNEIFLVEGIDNKPKKIKEFIMKVINFRLKGVSLILLVTLLLAKTPLIWAQDEQLLSDADAILNSEQIDVDGQWGAAPKREVSDEEIVENSKKIAKRKNVVRIADKIKQLKVPEKQIKKITKNEEAKLVKSIEDVFNNGEVIEQDAVQVKQAAPVAPKVVAEVEKVDPAPKRKVAKITPYFGILNIQGDGFDFESKSSFGAYIEAQVSQRFSMGVGINYSTLDLTYIDRSRYMPYNNFTNDYRTRYGSSREMTYKHLALELNSKFYFTVESRVRPYLGVSLLYNRTNLKYKDSEDERTYNFSGTIYGDEQYTSNYVAGALGLGAAFAFSDTLDASIEVRYGKGFTSGFNNESTAFNNDQKNLDSLGEKMNDAGFMSINAGVGISF